MKNAGFGETNPQSPIGALCSQLADEEAVARAITGSQHVFFRDFRKCKKEFVSDRSQNHEKCESLRDSPSLKPDRILVFTCHGGTANSGGFPKINTWVSIDGRV